MDELDFITNPDNWPQWPRLPLVRKDGSSPRIGLIFDSDPPYRVYLGNIWDDRPVEFMKYIDYPTAQALVADWRID